MTSIIEKLSNTYRNRQVLITGHTGFKGCWLAHILAKLGAKVTGLSDKIPTSPSMFEFTRATQLLEHRFLDIRDHRQLANLVAEVHPEFVFHLAAQSLVLNSYNDPCATFHINALGTLNLLDALRLNELQCSVVSITSDKVYENKESPDGYSETSQLGGTDPYSASKTAAEFAIRMFCKTYQSNGSLRVAVARAGNVIGGGDWAPNRVVPDAVRSWANGSPLMVRNPNSVRPWQHVLEPLYGYLILGEALTRNPELHAQPFNFGPSTLELYTVSELLNESILQWPGARWDRSQDQKSVVPETNCLCLNSARAHDMLGWKTILNFEETVQWTMEWYRNYYYSQGAENDLTNSQIDNYLRIAQEQG